MRERYVDFIHKFGDPEDRERYTGWHHYHGQGAVGVKDEYRTMLKDDKMRKHIDKIANLHKGSKK